MKVLNKNADFGQRFFCIIKLIYCEDSEKVTYGDSRVPKFYRGAR